MDTLTDTTGARQNASIVSDRSDHHVSFNDDPSALSQRIQDDPSFSASRQGESISSESAPRLERACVCSDTYSLCVSDSHRRAFEYLAEKSRNVMINYTLFIYIFL